MPPTLRARTASAASERDSNGLSKVYPPHSAQLDQLTQVLADKIDAELYDVLGRRSRVVLRRKPLACRHCAISCGRRWLNSNAPGSWCARKTRVSRYARWVRARLGRSMKCVSCSSARQRCAFRCQRRRGDRAAGAIARGLWRAFAGPKLQRRACSQRRLSSDDVRCLWQYLPGRIDQALHVG